MLYMPGMDGAAGSVCNSLKSDFPLFAVVSRLHHCYIMAVTTFNLQKHVCMILLYHGNTVNLHVCMTLHCWSVVHLLLLHTGIPHRHRSREKNSRLL